MTMQAQYWDEVAGPSWAAAQEPMDRMLAGYAETLREVVTVPAGARIVDVGCGCGATTLMAREQSPEADILGIDVSRPMLAVAERRAGLEGTLSARLRFLHADAATCALQPGSVDRVVSRFGVMFFAEPAAAFAHMREWLAPGGRMVIVVWGEAAENPWMTDALRVLAPHLPLPPSDPAAPGPFSLGAAGHRQRVFDAAGLRVVEELALRAPVRVEGDVEAVVRFYTERGPVAALLAEASATLREQALGGLREHVAARHDGGGVTLAAKALRVTLVAG